MPRPVNYVAKLRKWARSSNGDEGLRLALLNCLNLYNAGELKIEEVNKMVDKYSKTVVKEEIQKDEISQLDKELLEYLSLVDDTLEN